MRICTSLTFDSTQYPDGKLLVTIASTDVMGNMGKIEHSITVANDTLTVSMQTKERYATPDITINGEVFNAAPPFNVWINDDKVALQDTLFQVPVSLTEGVNTVTGRVVDVLDRAYDFTQVIEVDLTPPSVSIIPSTSVSLIDEVGNKKAGAYPSDSSESIYIGYDAVALGLTPLTKVELDKREMVYLEIMAEDEGEVNSPKANLIYAYSFAVNGETLTDKQVLYPNADNQIVFPLTKEFLTGLLSIKESDEITLSFFATDEVGNVGEYHHNVSLFVDLPVLSQESMFTGEAAFTHYQSPTATTEISSCTIDSKMMCETKFTQLCILNIFFITLYFEKNTYDTHSVFKRVMLSNKKLFPFNDNIEIAISKKPYTYIYLKESNVIRLRASLKDIIHINPYLTKTSRNTAISPNAVS